MQIDYSMEKTPDGWKVYDVIVGGVSLVTNYRDEFNDADQERRHRRPDQDAGRQEQGSAGQVTLDVRAAAPAERRRFVVADDGGAGRSPAR